MSVKKKNNKKVLKEMVLGFACIEIVKLLKIDRVDRHSTHLKKKKRIFMK